MKKTIIFSGLLLCLWNIVYTTQCSSVDTLLYLSIEIIEEGNKSGRTYTPETMPDDFLVSGFRQGSAFTGPMGYILPEDFGESKYDRDISVSELLEGGDLDKVRARVSTTETLKENIFLNIFGGICIVVFPLFVLIHILKKLS